jgi:hypothetical protein
MPAGQFFAGWDSFTLIEIVKRVPTPFSCARARKRRPRNYRLLNKPRAVLRAAAVKAPPEELEGAA